MKKTITPWGTPLFFTAISACFGFYFLFSAHIAVTVTALVLSLFALCFFRVLASFNERMNAPHITAVCIAAGFVLGLCAADAGQNKVNFGIPHEKITAIEGVLLEDPRALASGTIMASVSLQRSSIQNRQENARVSSKGVITVFFPPESSQRLREFGRGTRIFAEGALRSNEHGWSFSAVSLHIVKPAPQYERMRTGIRLNLLNRFDGKTWGGLALALLVGIRDNLDNNLTAVYRGAGLSYILALSGMHLAVITALISFLLKRPLGLKAASITGAVIISLYCLLVGPMPSLNRSAIMYLLGVLALLGSLPKNSMSILSLSFLIQIIITPAAGNSLSFILSYLALLGILITSRQISSLLGGIIPDIVLQPLSLSCGAFLATAGVCSYFFGMIAPVGILAGLVIVPLTTVFMVGSILWLVLDLFSLSFILSYPLSWIYRLMELTSSLAGNVPAIRANPLIVLILSIVLLLLIAIFEQKRREALLKLKSFT
ncbi:MAG: ComEC/Rec2 family competence protein [Treponema sp.]|nr:ComEC/Rec2 family competence protein [Treponema sp.]